MDLNLIDYTLLSSLKLIKNKKRTRNKKTYRIFKYDKYENKPVDLDSIDSNNKNYYLILQRGKVMTDGKIDFTISHIENANDFLKSINADVNIYLIKESLLKKIDESWILFSDYLEEKTNEELKKINKTSKEIISLYNEDCDYEVKNLVNCIDVNFIPTNCIAYNFCKRIKKIPLNKKTYEKLFKTLVSIKRVSYSDSNTSVIRKLINNFYDKYPLLKHLYVYNSDKNTISDHVINYINMIEKESLDKKSKCA